MDTLILGISPEEGVLMGRPSKYPAEFREQAVELVKASGKTVAEVARDLKINDTTLGTGSRPTGPSGVCRTRAGCCR